jgi:hypothetical protein
VRRGAAERNRALGGIQREQGPFEELAHDAERHVLLELSPARGEDLHPLVAGESCRAAEQGCLAETRARADGHEPAATVADLAEPAVDRRELSLAADERGLADAVSSPHGDFTRPPRAAATAKAVTRTPAHSTTLLPVLKLLSHSAWKKLL